MLRSAAQIPDPLLQRMASHVGGIPFPIPFPECKGDSKNRVHQRQALGLEPPHFLRHHGNSGRLDGAEPREDAEGKRCEMGQQRAPACHTQSPCHPPLPPTQHRDWHLVNVQIIIATRIMRMLMVIVNIPRALTAIRNRLRHAQTPLVKVTELRSPYQLKGESTIK